MSSSGEMSDSYVSSNSDGDSPPIFPTKSKLNILSQQYTNNETHRILNGEVSDSDDSNVVEGFGDGSDFCVYSNNKKKKKLNVLSLILHSQIDN